MLKTYAALTKEGDYRGMARRRRIFEVASVIATMAIIAMVYLRV